MHLLEYFFGLVPTFTLFKPYKMTPSQKLLQHRKETLKEYADYVLSRASLCEDFWIQTKKQARDFLDVQNQPLETEEESTARESGYLRWIEDAISIINWQ